MVHPLWILIVLGGNFYSILFTIVGSANMSVGMARRLGISLSILLQVSMTSFYFYRSTEVIIIYSFIFISIYANPFLSFYSMLENSDGQVK